MNRRNFIKSGLVAAGTLILSASGLEMQACAGNKTKNENKTSGGKKMKIVVLTGSPRRNGNTNYLASQFIKGAEEAGHEVFRFDSAFSNVHPCLGCNHCGMEGTCVFDDDFSKICRPKLAEAELVVLCTPMYYFGVSAQLKTVIDRWYAMNGTLHSPRKCMLIMAYANTSKEDAAPIIAHYKRICSYMGWEDVGQLIAPGMWPAGAVNNTSYAQKAYEMGKSL